MAKLLICDDEPHIRLLLEEALEDLEDEGIELLFAEDGEEAMEIILRESPRMVLLDIMMPKRNGFDVCWEIKKTRALPDVFVVMLTAKGQEVDKQRGKECGADRYMTKPFAPTEVVALARDVLGLA
ncbi:MAG: response regulator transcription factor [Desulfovibrionaceae bacterium]